MVGVLEAHSPQHCQASSSDAGWSSAWVCSVLGLACVAGAPEQMEGSSLCLAGTSTAVGVAGAHAHAFGMSGELVSHPEKLEIIMMIFTLVI